MALSRKLLKALLAEHENRDEIIDEIIDAHAETVAGLKAELTKLQEENGGKTAEELHAELERLTAELEQIKAGSEDGTTFKAQYDALKAEYNAFKTEHEKKQAYREKEKAFRSMLIQEGVTKHVDMLVRFHDDLISSMELQDGKVRNHETISAAIRSECQDFIDSSKPLKPVAKTHTR